VALVSGGEYTKSIREITLELTKNISLHKDSYHRFKSVEYDLKMLEKAKSLDDKLPDKTKNREMQKIIEYYDSYFDEESGNRREEGIKQVHEYLKEEAKSHFNSYNNIKMKIANLQKELAERKAVEGNQKLVEESKKKVVEDTKNSFSLLPIIPINSFTVFRILL
jgi:hypothetical protein